MKRILLSCMLALVVKLVAAQDPNSFKPYQLSVEFFKTDGRPFVNGAYDAEGSPFFSDDWRSGYAITTSGKVIGPLQMRLNCQTQEMHFLDKEGKEMALPGGLIKEIRFKGVGVGLDSMGTVFRSGLPVVDELSAGTFYEVIADGGMQLLCARTKTISTTRNPSSGEVRKEFVLYEGYYLFDGKRMLRVKKDKSFIANALSGKGGNISDYIVKNKLRMKTVDEIKQVVDYYNTLP